jgi:hypothetical protein
MDSPIAAKRPVSMAAIPPNATKDVVLAMLGAGTITAQSAAAWLDADTAAKVAAARALRPQNNLRCKVSEKKALSIYGLQRMPVTLYVEQWERLLAFADEVRTFIVTHTAEFSRK